MLFWTKVCSLTIKLIFNLNIFFNKNRWFIIKDSYVVYIRPDTYEIRFPMLVDQGFSIEQGFRKTGTNNGIQIRNNQRAMTLKCDTERERDQWITHLIKMTEKCDFTRDTNIRFPFNSYAPARQNQYAH